MKNLWVFDPASYSSDTAPEQLGGKGANLLRLFRMGMPVPPFVVIPHDVLQGFLPKDIDLAAIPSFIAGYSFQEAFIQDILSHFSAEHRHFAVRSSALNEDGAGSSFAGQFDTKLYVSPHQMSDAIRAVWLSAFSARVQLYAQERSEAQPTGMSIIIQAMVPAEVAGVAFGINPTEGYRDAKVISAVYGLGEGLVSGELDADTYVVRPSGVEKSVVVKREGFFYSIEDQKVVSKKITETQQDKPALDDAQIQQICVILDQLRQATGRPQDIEFAYAKDQLYMLQTRPVTNLDRLTDRSGHRIVWDNSNIIESYPGVTTPLTFSFILKMYDAVYRQLAVLLGVREATIEANSDAFANMLGLLRGRVYYNLESWYRTLALVPGYKINARFMETMMGVKERFDLPQERVSRTRAWFDLLVAVFKMLRSLLRLSGERRRFKQTLDKIIARYEGYHFDLMPPYDIMEHYRHFEDFLVKRWKAPLVNDFFAMIYFGLLKKQCEKLAPDHPNLHNDLLAGSRDIVSTEPVRRILDITDTILNHAGASDFFKKHTAQIVWENRENYPEIAAKINAYLHDFGERTVGELKLETITYTQEPTAFIAIIQSYVTQGIRKRMRNEEETTRATAEQAIAQALRFKPLKRLFIQFLIKKTRILVSARENLRYERTRGFGMVRRMFLAIGKQFYAEHLTEHPRDVFYLTRDEIFDYIKGTSHTLRIRELIALRKVEFTAYETEAPLAERITTYGMVYHANDFRNQTAPQQAAAEGELIKGLGCSAGIVRGRVRVVLRPDETPSLDGDILVTASTDPGWVTLFPSASAILVERGSLLSHSAIVSRELGIPCIVGITGLLQRLKTGDWVEMNGATGEIRVLTEERLL